MQYRSPQPSIPGEMADGRFNHKDTKNTKENLLIYGKFQDMLGLVLDAETQIMPGMAARFLLRVMEHD